MTNSLSLCVHARVETQVHNVQACSYILLHILNCQTLFFLNHSIFINSLETGSTRPPKVFWSQNWPLCTTDLANGQVVSLGTDHLHLNTIHQPLQLVPDVPGSSHGAELDEVLIAPLCGVTALHPLREKDITTAVSTPGF